MESGFKKERAAYMQWIAELQRAGKICMALIPLFEVMSILDAVDAINEGEDPTCAYLGTVLCSFTEGAEQIISNPGENQEDWLHLGKQFK